MDGSVPYIRRQSIADRWQQFEGVVTVPEPGEPSAGRTDVIGFVPDRRMIALSEEALSRTNELWSLVEVLPLRCRTEGDYSAVHVTTQRDVINLAASTFYAPIHGVHGSTEFVVFEVDTSELSEIDLFRVPQSSSMFCTQAFLDRLHSLEVTGWSGTQIYPPTAEQLDRENVLLRESEEGVLRSEVVFGDRSLRGASPSSDSSSR